MRSVVLYHSSCYDGFGAAFCAWLSLGDGAKYIPVSYGKPIPDVSGDHLFILDFAYSEVEMLELIGLRKFKKITVLDHHVTAQAKLEPLVNRFENVEIIFDMTRSGALITWDYFNPGMGAPRLIQHISDRDLWEFKLKDSRAVHKALVSYPMDFQTWAGFDVHELIRRGRPLLELYDQLVANICKSQWDQNIDGHLVPVVNTSIAWSEVGERLLIQNPTVPFVASFTVFETEVMWSLRSRKNEGFDVSEVALKFGGGGHKTAAGFKAVRP